MPNHRALAVAAYLVAASLILVPLLDATLAISPMRPTDFRWRFGATGVLSNAVMTPNAGVLLLLITAISYGHANFRRTIGALAFVAAAFWTVAISMFVLDALQMQPSVPAEMKTSFTVASSLALAKMVVDGTVLLALGFVGVRKSSGAAASSEPPLLMADPKKTPR